MARGFSAVPMFERDPQNMRHTQKMGVVRLQMSQSLEVKKKGQEE